MVKLTKRAVDGLLAAANGKEIVTWDEDAPGFGLRVKPSGAASWVIQYRNQHGRSRRLTLGKVGRLTPDEARKEAKQKLAAVDRGQDPADERTAARNALTVAELCEEYLKAGRGRIKDSTLYMDRGRIDAHVKPLLGSHPVAGLKPSDIERFFRDIAAGKTAVKAPPAKDKKTKNKRGGVTRGGSSAAIRATEMLGTILQRAVRDGILATNPAHGLRRPKQQPTPPAFGFDRVMAVGKAMRDIEANEMADLKGVRLETQAAFRATRLLVLTGCRRTEALTLQWGDVDFSAGCLRLRDSKTGKQVRPIGRAALDHLASFKPKNAKPTNYVFPGFSGESGHFVGLPKAWTRIVARANISDVSLHGLRHWFASAAAEMNYSDFVIGGMLGHAKRGVTGRYANAPDSALLMAADRVSQRLAGALDGTKGGKVVHMGRQTG